MSNPTGTTPVTPAVAQAARLSAPEKAAIRKMAQAGGDLTPLNQAERDIVQRVMCRRMDIDPDSFPFQVIEFKRGPEKKTIFYAPRGLFDYLASRDNLHLIVANSHIQGNTIIFTARVTARNGRVVEDIGAAPVSFTGTGGEQTAAGVMKAWTRAVRRALSRFYGASVLDESEKDAVESSAAPFAAPAPASSFIKSHTTVGEVAATAPMPPVAPADPAVAAQALEFEAHVKELKARCKQARGVDVSPVFELYLGSLFKRTFKMGERPTLTEMQSVVKDPFLAE